MDWDGCPTNFLIWGGMDLDPTLRGGLEMELKTCPVKTSSSRVETVVVTDDGYVHRVNGLRNKVA